MRISGQLHGDDGEADSDERAQRGEGEPFALHLVGTLKVVATLEDFISRRCRFLYDGHDYG